LRTRSKLAAGFGVLALAAVGTLALAVPAQAAPPKAEHRTVVTNITDRPENGNHGVWATDTLTRTVELTGGPAYVLREMSAKAADAKVAETKTQHPEFTVCDLTEHLGLRWEYTATVTDVGTFVTKVGAALSPNGGKPLTGGVTGDVKGSFTATFTAPAHWCTYTAKALNGKTVTGDKAPKTSEWMKALFTSGFDGSAINNDWTWTYKTCAESWWDAADPKSNDGEMGDAGDITGKACEAPKPEQPGGTGTGSGGDSGGSASLPVTGVSGSKIAGVAGVLLAAGVGGVLLVRRRRVRFEA
jgi:LPXTG-motif cell wall-anchored protein